MAQTNVTLRGHELIEKLGFDKQMLTLLLVGTNGRMPTTEGELETFLLNAVAFHKIIPGGSGPSNMINPTRITLGDAQ